MTWLTLASIIIKLAYLGFYNHRRYHTLAESDEGLMAPVGSQKRWEQKTNPNRSEEETEMSSELCWHSLKKNMTMRCMCLKPTGNFVTFYGRTKTLK